MITDNSNLTIVDASDHSIAVVALASGVSRIAINPATSKIYDTDETSNRVFVVDGLTHERTQVPVGTTPRESP